MGALVFPLFLLFLVIKTNIMQNKILITGATGFIGKQLIPFLLKNNYKIHVLTRKKIPTTEANLIYFLWNPKEGEIDVAAFEGVDTIINLVGAGIAEKRWTSARKKELLESRVLTLKLLEQYIKKHEFPIKTLISSSAVGYYGAISSERILEEHDEVGKDFLGKIVKDWEEAAFAMEKLGLRVLCLRKGVVIGKGGIYAKMAPLAKRGINPGLGKGNQYLPWIAMQDLLALYNFILKNPEMQGAYNVVASEHLTMNQFSQSLLHSFNKKSFFPNLPSFLLKIIFGEMAIMFLEGTRVSNQKLKASGFEFKFDTLKEIFLNLKNN